LHPQARTWVAVQQNTEPGILSSLTLLGPFEETGRASAIAAPGAAPEPETADLMRWEINGVWTAPEARRRGISRRLLAEAARYASQEAAAAGKNFMLDLVVAAGNDAVKSFYEGVGFVIAETLEDGGMHLVRYYDN